MAGQALIVVLTAVLALQVTLATFLSRVHREQMLSGNSTRGLAAFYLAEAGLQKVLWSLEHPTPDAPGDSHGIDASVVSLGAGSFAIEAIEHLPGGLIAVTVRGEAAGAQRRVKALVRAGPDALGYGIYAHDTAVFDGESKTYVVPCRAGGGCRRGGDLASGGIASFDSVKVALNAFDGTRLRLRDGEGADTGLLLTQAAREDSSGLLDIVLAGEAHLRSGVLQRRADLAELQRRIRGIHARGLRARDPVRMPVVEAGYFAAQAEANTANAMASAAVYMPWDDARPRTRGDSRFGEEQFLAILEHLTTRPSAVLRGVIYIDGDLVLEEGMRLRIEGALVVNGGIEVGAGARLEVRHDLSTQRLPGIVTLGDGSVAIRDGAVVTVDGPILAGKDILVYGGALDVRGAVVARNFIHKDGVVVVRYDSAVLSTVGLRRDGRGRVDLLSWQELP